MRKHAARLHREHSTEFCSVFQEHARSIYGSDFKAIVLEQPLLLAPGTSLPTPVVLLAPYTLSGKNLKFQRYNMKCSGKRDTT